eukprot:m.501705 g.501705  ORF g.501705 m.501705 type:complete len:141 (-) comp57333_c0_seq14:1719-2141(-)
MLVLVPVRHDPSKLRIACWNVHLASGQYPKLAYEAFAVIAGRLSDVSLRSPSKFIHPLSRFDVVCPLEVTSSWNIQEVQEALRVYDDSYNVQRTTNLDNTRKKHEFAVLITRGAVVKPSPVLLSYIEKSPPWLAILGVSN